MLKNSIQGLLNINHQQLTENPLAYQQQWLGKWSDLVSACDSENFQQIKTVQELIEQLGLDEQHQFWQSNEQLKRPLQQMIQDANKGGQVAELFKQLHKQLEKIKPPRQTLMARFMNHFKLLFSWHETAFDLWLETYPEQQHAIQQTVEQLAKAKRRLKQQNNSLETEQKQIAGSISKLEQVTDLLNDLQQSWQQHDQPTEPPEFIQQEFLPKLQERIIELQQQLLIARQTLMSLELYMQQNQDQINGIDHAVQSTEPVLRITASLSLLNNRSNNLVEQQNIKPVSIKETRNVVADALSLIDQLKS